MQSTSKEFILEHLSFLTEKAELAFERTSNVHCANDFYAHRAVWTCSM